MARKKVFIDKLCKCGCGQPIGDWGYRTDRDPPEFIKGHYFKSNRKKRNILNITNLCACGCGEIIGEWLERPDRQPPKYKPQHVFKRDAMPRKLNKKGYVLVYKPEYRNSYKNGYILEHRYVMELHLKRDLLPNEDVHHINEIKDDNRIDNLEIVNHSEHKKKYHKK